MGFLGIKIDDKWNNVKEIIFSSQYLYIKGCSFVILLVI